MLYTLHYSTFLLSILYGAMYFCTVKHMIFQRNLRRLHECKISAKMVRLGKYFIKRQNHLMCFYYCYISSIKLF